LVVPEWAVPHRPVCAAIAAFLHPHAEVVLNDIASDRIVGIWNPLSGRKVGDPAYLAELPADEGAGPLVPYRKALVDGRELSCVTAVVPGRDGTPQGLFCLNLDRSPLEGAAELLRSFAAPVVGRPADLFARDWREQIALTVDEECRKLGLRRDRLRRDDRLALVGLLDDRRLFGTRGAAEHAARALGVSRATVYTLLKEARR
jgi:predicted transcriptional regulator YheO